MMTEYIEVVKKLWTQQKTSYRGKYYTLEDAYCEPKPVQKPHPPILIGGGGEQLMLKIVARYADKCNFIGSPEVVKRKLDILGENCSRIGRDYESILKTMNIFVVIAISRGSYLHDMKKRYVAEGSPGNFQDWLKNAETYYVSGTPEECLEQIYRYLDLGIEKFIIRFGDFPKTNELNLFTKEVMEKLD
jgi:alkanesulfonate monooxygenase SsuD/methylene tetrahydromethanopterin reductase-like flavin-dependent oxidoreductase (luciferase family)